MIRTIVADLQQGVSIPQIAGRFHRSVAELLAAAYLRARKQSGLKVVALSGGVFQNRLLLEQLVTRLEALSFQMYLNRRVPPNDGGLAGGDGGHFAEAGLDFCFVVQSHDPRVVQETH